MPTTFSRSLRSLEADGFRRAVWALVLVFILLSVGLGWFFFAKVAVYETTDRGRLEVERAAHPVSTPVAGRVVTSRLGLGNKVQAGDLLVELESEGERLQLEEAKSRLANAQKRQAALRNQINAEQQAWPEERKTASLAIDEAKAREHEAEAAAKFAEGEAERFKKLSENGLLSKSDLLKAESEGQKNRAATAAQELTVSRLESELKAKEKNHEVRVAQLEREAALIEGDISTLDTTIKRNEFLLAQRQIRAPVTGQLGEIAELKPGGFLAEGQKIAVIIPEGEVKLVAQFDPLTAAGRVRPGQLGRLRLAGYPWAQYGSVAAQVTGVANEPRDGQLRVELSVKPGSAPMIPLQHGLAGTVEVQVDGLSPATLVLRAAGKLMSEPKTQAASIQ